MARQRLDGRRYVVAGAGQGIGRQTCHAPAQAGAAGIVCADVELDRAEHVAAEIRVGLPYVADITRRDGVEALADLTKREFGGLDGFVDIVGVARWGGVLEFDDATWDESPSISHCVTPSCSRSSSAASWWTTGAGRWSSSRR